MKPGFAEQYLVLRDRLVYDTLRERQRQFMRDRAETHHSGLGFSRHEAKPRLYKNPIWFFRKGFYCFSPLILALGFCLHANQTIVFASLGKTGKIYLVTDFGEGIGTSYRVSVWVLLKN